MSCFGKWQDKFFPCHLSKGRRAAPGRMRLTRAPCKKTPMLSVMLPSHDLEPLVSFLKSRRVASYQIVINQGTFMRQFRCAVQVRLRQEADLAACLHPPGLSTGTCSAQDYRPVLRRQPLPRQQLVERRTQPAAVQRQQPLLPQVQPSSSYTPTVAHHQRQGTSSSRVAHLSMARQPTAPPSSNSSSRWCSPSAALQQLSHSCHQQQHRRGLSRVAHTGLAHG